MEDKIVRLHFKEGGVSIPTIGVVSGLDAKRHECSFQEVKNGIQVTRGQFRCTIPYAHLKQWDYEQAPSNN